jgi:hypothetical protein
MHATVHDADADAAEVSLLKITTGSKYRIAFASQLAQRLFSSSPTTATARINRHYRAASLPSRFCIDADRASQLKRSVMLLDLSLEYEQPNANHRIQLESCLAGTKSWLSHHAPS